MSPAVQRRSEKLCTLPEAEKRTERKVSTWRKDIRLGKVPYVRIGRQIRIPVEFIDQMIAKGWHEPVEAP
jgi:hypothetical protein